jgi:hypothetical protein
MQLLDVCILQEAVNVPMHSASNIIPLHKNVESALDRFRITIVPDAGDVFKVRMRGHHMQSMALMSVVFQFIPPPLSACAHTQLKVLDPSLLVGQQSFVVEGIKWADLDGKDLTFDPGVPARPSAWVCAFHANEALAYAADPVRQWIAQVRSKVEACRDQGCSSRTDPRKFGPAGAAGDSAGV